MADGRRFQRASDAALAEKRPALEDSVGRLARARVWSLANVESNAAPLSKVVGVPVDAATEWLSRAMTRFVPVDDRAAPDGHKTTNTYVSFGIIQKQVRATDMLDASFNIAVVPHVTSG